MTRRSRLWGRIPFARSVAFERPQRGAISRWPMLSLALIAISILGGGDSLLVQHAEAAEAITTIGITEPFLDATLGTPVSGIVTTRRFKEGDFVKAGDVLVELDKQLEELEVTRRTVVLEPLKADYEANKTLFGQPNTSVSKEILDKKESDYKVALAEYELAKEQVRKRSIIAPFDGYIVEMLLQVGEAVHYQQPILRMADTRRCYFVGNVDAKAGHSLQIGQKVNLEIESGPAVALVEGRITFVSPVVDPASGLLKVKAVFENLEGKVRPGVAGKMSFQETANASARK